MCQALQIIRASCGLFDLVPLRRCAGWFGWMCMLAVIAPFTLRPVVFSAQPAGVSFSQSAQSIEAFGFVEITLNVASPDAKNPFAGAAVEGRFEKAGEPPIAVNGFCDSEDGSVYKIRFMPSQPGG